MPLEPYENDVGDDDSLSDMELIGPGSEESDGSSSDGSSWVYIPLDADDGDANACSNDASSDDSDDETVGDGDADAYPNDVDYESDSECGTTSSTVSYDTDDSEATDGELSDPITSNAEPGEQPQGSAHLFHNDAENMMDGQANDRNHGRCILPVRGAERTKRRMPPTRGQFRQSRRKPVFGIATRCKQCVSWSSSVNCYSPAR